MSKIPQAVADQLLVKCARHCCICRRFKPLHLHVHHIIERADGGGDEPDNLIATCITCHVDVHTDTKLTRRFTIGELKLHRDAVFALVAAGRLPATETDASPFLTLMGSAGRLLPETSRPEDRTLSAAAGEMLLAMVGADGEVAFVDNPGIIATKTRHFGDRSNPREYVKWKAVLLDLVSRKLIVRSRGDLLEVTESGYLFADALAAAIKQAADGGDAE